MPLLQSLRGSFRGGRLKTSRSSSAAPRSYGTSHLRVQAFALALGLSLACAAAALPTRAASADTVRIVALGDSLTAGYGLPAGQAFPDKLAKALAVNGFAVSLTNAGVSGDTVAGGLARLDWSVPDGTDAVIVELGANDALRGIDPKITRAGIAEILGRLKARGIEVLLCGMLAPRNMGADYAAEFDAIYPELAKSYGVTLYPFFLDGIATDAKFNQPDGVHPTAAGVDEIVRRIFPRVEDLIARAKSRRDR